MYYTIIKNEIRKNGENLLNRKRGYSGDSPNYKLLITNFFKGAFMNNSIRCVFLSATLLAASLFVGCVYDDCNTCPPPCSPCAPPCASTCTPPPCSVPCSTAPSCAPACPVVKPVCPVTPVCQTVCQPACQPVSQPACQPTTPVTQPAASTAELTPATYQ